VLVALVAAGSAYAAHRVLIGDKPPPYAPVFLGPMTLAPHDVPSDSTAIHGPELPYVVKSGEIRPGDTFSGAAERVGIPAALVDRIASRMKPVLAFSKVMPGDVFEAQFDLSGGLLRFEYQVSPVEVYVLEHGEDGEFDAFKEEFEEEMKVVWVTGTIESSLYETVIAINEDPELAMKIANEVFAWDIDFYSEAQKGDVFKVAVEKYVSGDYLIRYGRILAAEYAGGIGKKQSFFWRDPLGNAGYYNAQGVATRRVFLRSPLKYAHVTSRFGKRFHPILKRFKPHHGVDYGASTGTPVWAVADGAVASAGWNGGLGYAVKVKHSGGYTSLYGHLSKIAGGVRAGARVRQGQVVGAVGSTGLSTGPHLHFALLLDGSYVNPLRRVAPPTEPIPAKHLAAFKEAIRPWVEELEKVPAPAPTAPSFFFPPAEANAGGGLGLFSLAHDGER
jgi:murein DD-endopeptidase MepM/ murein hydrolase activator NlpD